MGSGHVVDPGAFAEKAALRLAECRAEIRRLGESEPGRRHKLLRRADRYAELVAHLHELAGFEGVPAGLDLSEIDRIREEVEAIKQRLLTAAGNLARDRSRMTEIQAELTAHGNGHEIDFDFEASPGGPEARAIEILRSLGL